jgi:type VI secretion system secreted protein Hcp
MKRYRLAGALIACAVAAAVLALVAGAFGNGSARAAQAAQAANVGTLTVQGLQGASSLELQSFSWGVTNPTTIGSGGGGAGTGKVQLGDVTVGRAIDSVSPRFFQAAATGQHFPSATIVLTTAKGSTMQYTFNTVFVTSVQHSSAGDGAVENLSLTYGSVEVESG